MTRWSFLAGACCLAVVFTGCSSSNRGTEINLSPEKEAIVHVGLAYREASNALKRAPKGVEDLKPYLKKYGDPDQVLTSPNDGQRYHIVWGTVATRPTKGNQVFLVYEETGKNGRRYAVDIRLKVYHLTDSEFSQMQGGK
jgi:hypothetical protein